MTGFEASPSSTSRVEFETIVENSVRDATELFNSRDPAEFSSIDEAKEAFVAYALDMYAIRAVSVDEIREKPPRPRQAVRHRATQLFDTHYANNHWDSTPEELF